jgi:hypothetical protein
MRIIWRSYGVDLTDNKSGLAKQETQHMPSAIAPKAMYLRNENGGRLTKIIVLMIPISIGYATDAFPTAPTIWHLIPRDLCQRGRLFESLVSLVSLVGFGRIHSDLVSVLDRLGRDSDIQYSTKTKPEIARGFTSNENTIPFSGRNFVLRKSVISPIGRYSAFGG